MYTASGEVIKFIENTKKTGELNGQQEEKA